MMQITFVVLKLPAPQFLRGVALGGCQRLFQRLAMQVGDRFDRAGIYHREGLVEMFFRQGGRGSIDMTSSIMSSTSSISSGFLERYAHAAES